MRSEVGGGPVVDVLVVDDEPGISRIVKLLLQSEGFDVRVEGHARTALKVATSEPVRLVLLDLNMPEMDGREFYRELRAHEQSVPVVIMSASGARKAYKELGAEGFLDKPFSPEALIDVVERVGGVAR